VARDLLTTDVDDAVAALRHGGLVAIPTETVYGLAGIAADPAAVARIFEVKGRPSNHPVIVHVAAASGVDRWAQDVPAYARTLADQLWPGPLTLVLPRRPDMGDVAAAGLPTVGVRCPAHPMTNALLTRLDDAVAAPSANRFGRVSPTTAADVLAELADVLDPTRDRVLDGGPCPIGVESTIVDACGARPRLLRPGAIDPGIIHALTGLEVDAATGTERAPGLLAAHYAPRARLVVTEPAAAVDVLARLVDEGRGSDRGRRPEGATGPTRPTIGLLALADDVVDDDRVAPAAVVSLARPVDLDGYAHDLYRSLREADRQGLTVVVAVLPPADGVGVAIRDRLIRAATGSGRR
jgi:L-threonylcarbamoyladenylate synthase